MILSTSVHPSALEPVCSHNLSTQQVEGRRGGKLLCGSKKSCSFQASGHNKTVVRRCTLETASRGTEMIFKENRLFKVTYILLDTSLIWSCSFPLLLCLVDIFSFSFPGV